MSPPPRTAPAGVDAAEMKRAIEVFARGFAVTRSYTHPYVAERVGQAWVARDAPRRNGSYRNEEWIGWRLSPQRMVQVIGKHSRGRYSVCALHANHESDAELRAGYKALGYRLGTTEPLMVHRLRRIPRLQSPLPLQRVRTLEQARRLAKAAGRRQLLDEHLDRDHVRSYVALDGDTPVGWVTSVEVALTAGAEQAAAIATWCANMYVVRAYRRRGIARALMCQMLRDDRRRGAVAAVLLASHTGALLYPLVGYQQIGTLLLFTPPRAPRAR